MRVRPGGTGLELVSRQAGGSERRLAADRVVAAAGTTPSPPDSAWTWTRSWAPPACRPRSSTPTTTPAAPYARTAWTS
ncbi:hypothetical protein [Nonomuraea ferruginea]|uniref:FAD/NAD(P)-binding domain-containing protein n=1 Tax=Nonomuraea ferruginea TaxID=46174 RepID=A0ABT4T934_9ACTN|nr:hypothetical protein [Nonomuraea ferruginea]MDA0645929.1 hypothetical protein [Nonomuraea ferruginea]